MNLQTENEQLLKEIKKHKRINRELKRVVTGWKVGFWIMSLAFLVGLS